MLCHIRSCTARPARHISSTGSGVLPPGAPAHTGSITVSPDCLHLGKGSFASWLFPPLQQNNPHEEQVLCRAAHLDLPALPGTRPGCALFTCFPAVFTEGRGIRFSNGSSAHGLVQPPSAVWVRMALPQN